MCAHRLELYLPWAPIPSDPQGVCLQGTYSGEVPFLRKSFNRPKS